MKSTLSVPFLLLIGGVLSNPVPSSLSRREDEFGYCIRPSNISKCLTAKTDASTATTAAEVEFPDTLHNGKGDAFRHCYWSALMTRHLGEAQAKIFGDLHENSELEQPQEERAMDLANNASGRAIGTASADEDEVYEACYSAASQGKLVTIVCC